MTSYVIDSVYFIACGVVIGAPAGYAFAKFEARIRRWRHH